MPYLADESVARPIVSALRQAGCDVLCVSARWPGMSDPDVLARAQELKSIVLTGDKDFGELVFRRHMHTHGVVLFRFSGLRQDEKATRAVVAFGTHSAKFTDSFTVVDGKRVRLRTR